MTTLGLFAVILVVGGTTTPGFLSVENARAVVLSSAFVGIIAVGMTLIMLCGRLFSMALGMTSAIGAFAFFYGLHFGLVAAILIAIALTAAFGWIQGLIIGGLGANPIIVTIAASVIMGGTALLVTDGVTVLPPAGDHSFAFLNGRPFGIPISFLIFVLLVVVIELMLRTTRFGREIYAVGENLDAARAAAINIPRVTAAAFAIAGACAGVAGILLAAFNENATLSIEGDRNFDAIAAVLVGGSLVTGGRGSAVRTFFGAIVIAMLASLLLIRGYSTGVQLLVKGAIVLIVVCVMHLGDRGGRR
ncbi:ABC transporter permease [Microbacterium aurantiacum]|uniref:ABC transporter permease n=1 Tax=Microbacterium aurantiacum TaxID=162393 RepID=UPI003449B90C